MGDEKRDGVLIEVVARRRQKPGLFWWEDSGSRRYIFADRKDRADDATTLLAYLPELFDEHLRLRDCTEKLLLIVAQQQAQLVELGARVDATRQEAIQAKLKLSVDEMVDKLLAQGTRIDKYEVETSLEVRVHGWG